MDAISRTPDMMPLNRGFMPLRKFYSLGDESSGPMKIERDKAVDPLEAKKARLKESAKGFEAIFVRQLLSAMRSTVPGGGMFGDGAAGKIYADIVETSLADVLSERGALGIGDTLYRSLVKRIDPHAERNGHSGVLGREISK